MPCSFAKSKKPIYVWSTRAQFRKTFEEAARRKGVTGENLIKLLEARLDNTVFRLGIAPSRGGARQLVAHKHVMVNGEVTNVPSFQLKPGDVIELKPSATQKTGLTSMIKGKNPKFSWLDGMKLRWQVLLSPILKEKVFLKILKSS